MTSLSLSSTVLTVELLLLSALYRAGSSPSLLSDPFWSSLWDSPIDCLCKCLLSSSKMCSGKKKTSHLESAACFRASRFSGQEKGGERIRELTAKEATTKDSVNVLFEDVLVSHRTFQWWRKTGRSEVLMTPLCCNASGWKRNKWNICIEQKRRLMYGLTGLGVFKR